MEVTNIGDYVVSIELDRVEGSFKYYDAVLSKDGKEVRIHKAVLVSLQVSIGVSH